MGYTAEYDRETTARVIGRELKISPKKAVEVCRLLKGMELSQARDFLEDVADMKRAVPYRRYVRSIGHRRGMGTGGYPRNVARAILKLLDGVENNAEYIGLSTDKLQIVHIAAHRGRTYRSMMPRAHGRSTPKVERTTNIEIIVGEMEEE